ncbi:PHP domain-containing protein [Eubacteriales bacterium KG127]
MNIFKHNGKKYRMIWDYHTHTVFSHGKGTIEDNVKVAIEKGLDKLAISDHGPEHLTYGVKRKNFSVMREEIDRLNQKYPEISIFLSVEANIVNYGNNIDVMEEEKKFFDFIHAGYHFGILRGYMIGNWLWAHRIGKILEKKLIRKNTEMMVSAIEKNKIKILTHPGDKAPIYLDKVVKACERTGTLMEINPWHGHLTVDELVFCKDYDVNFCISSDAHDPRHVGGFKTGLLMAFDAGIDIDRIVNVEEV